MSRLKVRRANDGDIPFIYACQAAAYSGLPASALCDERLLRLQLETFPEGMLVAVRGDEVVGYATSLIVSLDEDSPWYSYQEITGGGTFTTHDPSGDTLYGADIAVHPGHRGKGVAGKLYEARKQLVRRLNLRRMVAGGRIPGYKSQAGRLSPEEYVAEVMAGRLSDSSLNAHLKAGYQVRGVHMGYLHDEQSLDYATFLELENPHFRPQRRRIAAAPLKRPVRKVRVCAAQFQVGTLSSWEEVAKQVRFFVATAERYHSHFLVFPELFGLGLFEPGRTRVSQLAEKREDYLALFGQAALSSGLFILAGSFPLAEDGRLYNVAHLFTPSGDAYTQEKLHLSPGERREFGLSPGRELRVFETGYGRVAMVVGHDIEFPEVARLLTLAGAEILFVPFRSDERKAYLRIRYSGQARAVENEVYTVLTGSVGNYAEALVFTPCDFAFPQDGVAAAAEFDSQTVVISDLDLEALTQAREMGSVRHLRERRTDLYTVNSLSSVRLVRTS
ncbi:MAG: bifunctional GNAT family N-acetyltransferase/carbon-nitrogen hydrolase family protein [Candidatus Eremiobacteraeota bacterium]|nr:bifunctional GNAT family N-acetyltransferase/carbon-nitrogen hydrolase family protein [Candidatus Eremiobacteraeota bacterium]